MRFLRTETPRCDVAICADFFSLHHEAVRRAAQEAEVPYIVWPHGCLDPVRIRLRFGTVKRAYIKIWGSRIFRDAAAAVALTTREVDQFAANGLPTDHAVVIPNGIPVRETALPPLKGAFRQKIDVAPDAPLVLYVGRLSREKGLDMLAAAFAELTQTLPGVRLALVGPDAGIGSDLRARFAACGLADDVVFCGMVSDRDEIKAAYYDADVFVLPSRSEGMALVWIEAAAMGTPVVITDRCGGDIVARWHAGSVIPFDCSQCVSALTRVLKDRGHRDRQGVQARSMVLAELTWERIAVRFEELLGECASEPPRRPPRSPAGG